MRFAPEVPTTRVPPTRVDTDTWVIHQVQNAFGAPLSMYLNSMVIAGRDPVIVDAGSVNNRGQWLEDVFGMVDPSDVRWVFLSHDDSDHTGNLAPVMESCKNATLVCSWAIVERFSNAFGFPLERCAGSTTVTQSTWGTGASVRSGRPSTTLRRPVGSWTIAPASSKRARRTGQQRRRPAPGAENERRRDRAHVRHQRPRLRPRHHELLDALKAAAPSRVVNVASTFAFGVDMDDLQFERRPYDGLTAYAQSKALDRMLTWVFARRLQGDAVTVNAMAPGLVLGTHLYRDLSRRRSATLRNTAAAACRREPAPRSGWQAAPRSTA